MADKNVGTKGEPAAEPRIVQATGVAAGLHTGEAKTAIAQALEDAMTKAVQTAIDEGVNDPEEMRARILAARDKALQES